MSNAAGEVVLMFAAEHDHVECARLLIALVGDVDHADSEGRTALFRAAAPEGFVTYEAAMMLVTSEVLDEADRPDLASCGFVASDSTAIVDALIAAGAEVDARDEDGVTPLMLTANCGCGRRGSKLCSGTVLTRSGRTERVESRWFTPRRIPTRACDSGA